MEAIRCFLEVLGLSFEALDHVLSRIRKSFEMLSIVPTNAYRKPDSARALIDNLQDDGVVAPPLDAMV